MTQFKATFNLEINSEGFWVWSGGPIFCKVNSIQKPTCCRGGPDLIWAHYEGLFASDLQHYEELSSARPSLNWEAWECNAVAAVSGGESGESPRSPVEKAEQGEGLWILSRERQRGVGGGQAARGCYLTSSEEYYNQCISLSHNTRALLVFNITGVIQISYLNK